MSVYKVKSSLLFISACLLTACGGGGGSDDVPLSSPYTPSVLVAGLDVGAAETVVFKLNGEAITATNNVRYNANSQVVGSYSAFVVTSPAGKTCTFTGGTTIYNGSAKPVTLTCGVGLPGGGGGGPITPGAGTAIDINDSPFQVYGWGSRREPNKALITRYASLTNFSNVGLTNATAANFSFAIDDIDVIPDNEHRFHVEPINAGVKLVAGAIAMDVSTSITDAEVVTMKQQLKNFFAGVGGGNIFRLTWFDDQVTEAAPYTNDPATLQAAVDTIPDQSNQRGSSTDLYFATRDASTSAVRSGLFDYVVMITDGDHSSSSIDVDNDYEDDTEANLIFAIAIGPNPNMAVLENVVTVRNEEAFIPGRVLQISDVSQLGAALQVISDYVANMMAGLHAIHYFTPRRDDNDIEFTYRASPAEACAAGTTLLGCGWFTEFNPVDPAPYSSDPTEIHVFANTLQALEGDTIRLRLPEWPSDNCSSAVTPYSWNLTVNSGGASLSAPRNNGREIDVVFDAGVASDIQVDVTNASHPLCAGSIALTSIVL